MQFFYYYFRCTVLSCFPILPTRLQNLTSDFLVPKQCVTEYVEKHQRCSQCPQAVKTSNPRYLEYLETLKNLFPKYTAPAVTTENKPSTSLVGKETISVVMLGGDSTVVPYRPGMTIQELKNFVQKRLGPAPEKQRLLCKEKELKVRGECIDCNMIIAFHSLTNTEVVQIEAFITLYFRLTRVRNWPPYRIIPYSHSTPFISLLCCMRLTTLLTMQFLTCFGAIPLVDEIIWMHLFLSIVGRLFKA